MSAKRPNLWRILSDTSRIISSNSLHFLSLSLIFIFPLSLFNIIYALLLQPSPSPSHPSPFNSHYRHLLSTVSNHDSVTQIPSFDKSLTLPQLLYGVASLIFNLCSVASITHSIFHGIHSKPIVSASSLKSILSSFLPLLATKIAYLIIVAAIIFGFGICMGFIFLGLMFLGFEIEPSSKPFMAVVFVTIILLLAVLVYLGVKWCLMDAVVVVESKYGFAPFERSSSLVKGARRVAFLMIMLFGILHLILSGWFSGLASGARSKGGCSLGVALQLVAYAWFSTALSLFGLAANTVLFVHCKAFVNGESEFESDEKKLGQVYVQLPHDVVDEV